MLHDKPGNLTVANITSRRAEISWLDPEYQRSNRYQLSRFLIKLKKENTLILNITTGRVNAYELNNLTPFTTYEISVASGNEYGFGEESVASFSTFEEGKCEIRIYANEYTATGNIYHFSTAFKQPLQKHYKYDKNA